MKNIDNNAPGSGYNWQNDLLKDLSFIKEKKRYPLSRKTLAPGALMGLLALAMLRIAWPLYFTSKINNQFVFWGSIILVAALIFAVFYRYYRALKFNSIHTPFYLQENRSALKKFLTTNHLAFTQHADAPEVFLIISRNLDANPKKEYREVMVFIAADKEILVNSHFVGNKFKTNPPSRNSRRMAKDLESWLDKHIRNSDSTAITVSSF